VSTSRFFAILIFSASLYAQLPSKPGVDLNEECRPSTGGCLSVGGEYRPQDPSHSQIYRDAESGFMPLVPDWPQPPAPQPISGVVSLHDLEHPIPEKALRAAYEAQQFSNAHNTAKAIAKLQKAIRIDPSYRDAHCNLGVLYARAGRPADARAEFEKALAIGPPAAPIYVDLALSSVAAGEIQAAQALARKALELDPANGGAQRILEALKH
jgi:tetratricopeptide (TPR) repeat protein